jgi:hypothetical protein
MSQSDKLGLYPSSKTVRKMIAFLMAIRFILFPKTGIIKYAWVIR